MLLRIYSKLGWTKSNNQWTVIIVLIIITSFLIYVYANSPFQLPKSCIGFPWRICASSNWLTVYFQVFLWFSVVDLLWSFWLSTSYCDACNHSFASTIGPRWSEDRQTRSIWAVCVPSSDRCEHLHKHVYLTYYSQYLTPAKRYSPELLAFLSNLLGSAIGAKPFLPYMAADLLQIKAKPEHKKMKIDTFTLELLDPKKESENEEYLQSDKFKYWFSSMINLH